MSEDAPRIQLLTMDIDEALSSIQGLQERVRNLEADTRVNLSKFLAFRTWAEQTLSLETHTRERRARTSSVTDILSVEINSVPSVARTSLTLSPSSAEIPSRLFVPCVVPSLK